MGSVGLKNEEVICFFNWREIKKKDLKLDIKY